MMSLFSDAARNVPTVGCFQSPLIVNRSPLSSVSVVGTLRAASVLSVSLSALILCVRKENICMVVIYLTQRALRTRSLDASAHHSPLTTHHSPLIVQRYYSPLVHQATQVTAHRSPLIVLRSSLNFQHSTLLFTFGSSS